MEKYQKNEHRLTINLLYFIYKYELAIFKILQILKQLISQP